MTLRELREESGLSRAEVAKSLHVTVQAIYRYEECTRRINIEQVIVLSKLYDCTAEEIIKAQLNSLNAQ